MHYRTIVISDLHLGTPDSQYNALRRFLDQHTYEHLILNGDIIDEWHIRLLGRWKKEYGEYIKFLLNLVKSGTKVTYIRGNHDEFWRHLIPIRINDIEICESMIYTSGDKTYYICHGHQFDRIEGNLFGITHISLTVSAFFYWLNRRYNRMRKWFGLSHQSMIDRIKWIGKFLMVGSQKTFEEEVKLLLKKEKCDGLICGHLHKPGNYPIDQYHYLNSGDWVENCTALVETSDHSRSLVFTRK